MLRDEQVGTHGSQPELRDAVGDRPLVLFWLLWLWLCCLALFLAPLCILDWHILFAQDHFAALRIQWHCSVHALLLW